MCKVNKQKNKNRVLDTGVADPDSEFLEFGMQILKLPFLIQVLKNAGNLVDIKIKYFHLF